MRALVIAVALLVGCAHAPQPGSAIARAPERRLSVGNDHACIFDEGDIACWGSTRSTEALARSLASIPGRLRAFVSRGGGTCAITDGGAVYCRSDWDREARRITDLEDAVYVATNRFRGCAARSDGRVRCWDNDWTATEVAGVHDAVEVELDIGGTCARLGDGRVSCWRRSAPPTDIRAIDDAIDLAVGWDLWIVRADGRVYPCNFKRCQRALRGIDDAVEVSAIGPHACARHADGRVSCWSASSFELTPIHPEWESPRTNRPVAIPGIDDARALAVDERGACVIEGDDGPRCWGDNQHFELGDDPDGDRLFVPRRVPLKDAVEVRVGTQHACAVDRGGALWCWGQRRGFDPSGARDGERGGPLRVASGIEHAWSGDHMTCAQTRDGEIRCWGAKVFGFLGAAKPMIIHPEPGAAFDLAGLWACSTGAVGLDCLGVANYRPEEHISDDLVWIRPQRWSIAAPERIETSAVALGSAHGCASGVDGRVYCWGIGSGLRDPEIPVVNDALPPLTGLAAGGKGTCGLDRDARPHCWGFDEPLPELPPLAAIRPGREHVCALDLDGRVWCWGANDVGQLGRGYVPRHEPPAPTLEKIVALDVHASTSCAIDADAQIWCWGANAGGQASAASPPRSTTALAVARERIFSARP